MSEILHTYLSVVAFFNVTVMPFPKMSHATQCHLLKKMQLFSKITVTIRRGSLFNYKVLITNLSLIDNSCLNLLLFNLFTFPRTSSVVIMAALTCALQSHNANLLLLPGEDIGAGNTNYKFPNG